MKHDKNTFCHEGDTVQAHEMSDVTFAVNVWEQGNDARQAILPNSDAPALALAILEAAGVESAYRSAYNAGSDWQLEHSVNELSEYVRARSEYEAEAEAQAKLEAEALELRNAYHKGIGYPSKDWSHLNDEQKEVWLAVARRARELNKEEK